MSAPTTPDVSLQINLCAGDLAYGEQVVRALSNTHRPDVREVFVVADACRPQSTPALHAPSRFPAAEFSVRIEQLRALCAALQAAGLVDRVVWLMPEPAGLRSLNTRYCGIATPRSHDHLGHAFSAYFLGWHSAHTRFVAHFDADILLWQQPGFSWIRTALQALAGEDDLIAASPRIAPPPPDGSLVHVGAPGSGWLPTWPLAPIPAGWRSPWFSTRCHLIDRERLARYLPLGGRAAHRRADLIERLLAPCFALGGLTGTHRSPLARRLTSRIPAFPLPPEVLLHEQAQARDFACLYLANPEAWFIHPDTKPPFFAEALPRLLDAVVRHGTVPTSQQGISGVQFSAWGMPTSGPR